MFAALSQVPGLSLPLFETRKALIIINLQNDSLYVKDDLYITKNPDFVPRLKEMIPYFRKYGDVVWVITHMGVVAPEPTPDAARVEEEATKLAEKNRQEREKAEKQLQDDTLSEEEAARREKLELIDPSAGPGKDYPMFYPSSRTKEIMTRASAETRAEKRSADLQVFNDKDNILEKHLSKPRKGQQARFYIAGTKGAEICDELLDVVDENRDLIVTKHHYSAFDQTSLLMALRQNLVTEVYLCGCLTNVGVYSTAADAVQHGLQVTVVEDCLGYRSEEKHEEAMRQMADIMGVNGIDSEEIIEESGGRPVPDAEMPGITLEELSLDANTSTADMEIARGGLEWGHQHGIVAPTVGAASAPFPQAVDDAGQKAPLTPTGMQSAQEHDGSNPRDVMAPDPDPSTTASQNRKSWSAPKATLLGPTDNIGSGDSRIIYNAISSSVISSAFERLKEEVVWQRMLHRSGQVPRLVAVQGEAEENGDVPIYRHPADESPTLLTFTQTVEQIRRKVEGLLSQSFNHALIQLYRDGIDNISEHADKTLDLVRNSIVVNVSIGAQRVMTLRTKKSRATQGTDLPNIRHSQRIKMPHNSIFVLGPQTNREWLHGVRADKRPVQEKTDEEKAFGGERISITFRQIGTFLNMNNRTIWGSGARQKSRDKANKIPFRDAPQMEAMINAFGKENHDTDFDWEAEYGHGFDVVNLINTKAKLIRCNDWIANIRVQLALYAKFIAFDTTKREPPPQAEPEEFRSRFHTWMHGLSNSENPIFQDVDDEATETEGDLAILFHLEKLYPFDEQDSHSQPDRSTYISHIAQANELLFAWREIRDSQQHGRNSPPTHRFTLERPVTPNQTLIEDFHGNLKTWERRAENTEFIAGGSWTIIDCAFWPVLHHVIENFDELTEERYPNLVDYHRRVLERESVKASLAHEVED